MNEFHDHDGLADTGTAEHGGLSSLREGSEKIHDLDAGFEYRGRRASVLKWWRASVDRHAGHIGGQWHTIVTSIADNVEEPSEYRIADWDRYRVSGRTHRHTTFEAGGGLKGDAAHRAFVEMRLDFDDQNAGLIPFDDEGLVKLWKDGLFEGNIDHRSAYGGDLPSWLHWWCHRGDHLHL